MTRKAKILSRVKSYLHINELTAERWWRTPNKALMCLAPHDYVKKIDNAWTRLDHFVRFSELRLNDFCTKDTGLCTNCDAQKAQKRRAWDRILGRRPEISNDTVATKTNNGTVATPSNDGTVATVGKLMTPQPPLSARSPKNPS